MENIFSDLVMYGSSWIVKSIRNFNSFEISLVKEARVVESLLDPTKKSCCFFMKNGKKAFQSMSNDDNSNIGDYVDLNTAKIITLEHVEKGLIIRRILNR